MKLTSSTISILKNFSTINQNLMVKPGNTLSTMSAMKNIVAQAEVTERFPQEFAIYDLNEFLSALSLFEEPELNFQEQYVTITQEGSRKNLKYWFSDPEVVTTPSKAIVMPSTEVTFNLSSDTLSEIQKAAAVIGAPDMALTNGSLMVTDKKNDTANAYDTELGVNETDAEYKFWFKVENLKLMSGSYDVEVSSKSISHFTNSAVGVEYWIALEPESTYSA
jgi:hypothetical protein|tara:strand:- start:181 stop:843 length:663 start_codon:yes stop_codon:yes gene_type:complete